MKKKICILGSTGSIGKTTLEILSENKKDFEVVLLSGNNNINLLISQARKFKPKYIYYNNIIFKNKIKIFCEKNKIYFIDDIKCLNKIKFDITVAAISGIAGLVPTLKIIKFSKKILIANKESIICGWKFISRELKKYHCHFTPIDSEHFSIFNLIKNKNLNSVKSIHLTASGGPFYGKKINLKKITPSQAIKHPKWKMGKKISVDSANLMNKVLEIIEASLIFNLPINKFKIVIHPQSLVHAIVEYKNGLFSMLYHENDMKIPILNSIYDDFNLNKKGKINFQLNNQLSFNKINNNQIPSIKILDMDKFLNENGFIIINTANEIFVEKFLKKEILFSDIVDKLLKLLNLKLVKAYIKNNKIKNINDVFKTYNFCLGLIK